MLVRCPGCDNLHLIADRLGWFEEGGADVRSLMAPGSSFQSNLDGNTLQLTAEDIQLLRTEMASKVQRKAAAEAGAASPHATSEAHPEAGLRQGHLF